jgi:hypothetical protein
MPETDEVDRHIGEQTARLPAPNETAALIDQIEKLQTRLTCDGVPPMGRNIGA